MTFHNSQSRIEDGFASDQISDDYRLEAYMIWYNSGKPTGAALQKVLKPDPASGIIPARTTVEYWVKNIFVPMALETDEQVADMIQNRIVEQRVEMLDRHAEIGRELQELGLDYLHEHGLKDQRGALMAVIKGVEMERDARIVPTDIVKKLAGMSDDKLLDTFTTMLQGGEILDITPTDADNPST